MSRRMPISSQSIRRSVARLAESRPRIELAKRSDLSTWCSSLASVGALHSSKERQVQLLPLVPQGKGDSLISGLPVLGLRGSTDVEPAGVGETRQQEKTVDHRQNDQQIAPSLRERTVVGILSRHDAEPQNRFCGFLGNRTGNGPYVYWSAKWQSWIAACSPPYLRVS